MTLDQDAQPTVSSSLGSALSASGFVGTWETDLSTKIVHLFGPFAKHLGFDANAGAQGISLAQFLERIHSEDRERVETLVDHAHRTAGRFECEFRTLDQDGDVHWISARGQVETDPKGRGLRCLGVALDVTDTRRAGLLPEEQFIRTINRTVDSLMSTRTLVTSLNIPILKTLIDVMLYECGTELNRRMLRPELRQPAFH